MRVHIHPLKSKLYSDETLMKCMTQTTMNKASCEGSHPSLKKQIIFGLKNAKSKHKKKE